MTKDNSNGIGSYEHAVETDYIEVIGAREHNLKDIDLRIPRNKLVVITGISGSGKSSLAFDTISVCFSKGLGAPVGSALVGDRRTIDKARHFRKMVGGSMRQSGVIAAGALYAIDHHRARLLEDHAAARRFAEIISESNGVRVDMDRVRTNMVYCDIDQRLGPASEFYKAMDRRGVRMFDEGPQTIRAVCHLDVTPEQVEQAARLIVDATRIA